MREFVPPGPGSWMLETTHFGTAAPRYCQKPLGEGLAQGFREGGENYGLPMETLQMGFVNDFTYAQQVMIGAPDDPSAKPPPLWVLSLLTRVMPEFRRRNKNALKALEERRWERDLAEWDDHYRQDSIARNLRLSDVDPSALSDDELAGYLNEIYDNLVEMIYRHHKWSVPAIFPVGCLIATGTQTGKLTAAECIAALKGSTPVSTGAFTEQLAALRTALEAAGMDREKLAGIPAENFVATLEAMDAAVASALNFYLRHVGKMLVSGYMITEKTVSETPNIIKTRVLHAFSEPPANGDNVIIASLRERLAGDELEQFDTWLGHARSINRLRDERGVYNDIWASGICRLGVLEAGRRLESRGILPDANLALEASHEEILALLGGEVPVSGQELDARRQWREQTRPEDVPQWLGHPPDTSPPPLDAFPAGLRMSTLAVISAMGNVNDEDDAEEAQGGSAAGDARGLAVSPGTYEGIARVISGPDDFARLEQGDVLVTKNTSAAFNVVLPILGALVTDRGGLLSHAAIVSREYGIPGVVATKQATRVIPDGARVRVDGDAGTVTVLS